MDQQFKTEVNKVTKSTSIILEEKFRILQNVQEFINVMSDVTSPDQILIWLRSLDVQSLSPMIFFAIRNHNQMVSRTLKYVMVYGVIFNEENMDDHQLYEIKKIKSIIGDVFSNTDSSFPIEKTKQFNDFKSNPNIKPVEINSEDFLAEWNSRYANVPNQEEYDRIIKGEPTMREIMTGEK